MELLIGLLALLFAVVAVAAPVVAGVAFVRTRQLGRELAALRAQVERLRPAAAEPGTATRAPAGGAATGADAAAAVPPPLPAATPSRAVTPAPPRGAAAPAPDVLPAPAFDFASAVGPRLLVAAGALALVAAVGFFVKYAWENEWVGPGGRVALGALVGLLLVVAGLRVMNRAYRPLGQGLAGAGLGALYVSAFAAHGFYALVPRGLAGILMLGVAASSVLLALRLEARLLAVLSALGAYLTPVLLSSGADRGEALVAYLALVGVGVVELERRTGWWENLVLAALGTLGLYTAWFERFFAPERFAVAAAGALAFAALFALLPRAGDAFRRGLLVAGGLGFGGVAAVAIAGGADRSAGLLLLLLALAAVALAARGRWTGAPAVAATLAGAATLAWSDRFLSPGRGREALLLALAVAALYLGALVWRGLARRQPLVVADVLAHVAVAGSLYLALERILGGPAPAPRLAAAAVALALLYLGLGLAVSREHASDRLQLATLLGTAAVFLTLAVPAQLGLHGVTLGWAAEAVLLLALGLRFQARLARLGGYALLALVVLRLVTLHLPLHPASAGVFRPFLNPAFGTWLGGLVALGLALRLLRAADAALSGAERGLRAVLAATLVVLLFGALSGETGAAFQQLERLARAAGDAAAAARAELAGGLALSLLWTLYATGLLALGLAVRSRGLFYTAYLLFAVTAAKVVLWDLATLRALYRVLSFLALGLLLLAGAWLNLRFSARLRKEVAS